MKSYFFERGDEVDLVEESKTDFRFYSVSSDKFARPFAILLIRPDHTFLKVRSFVYDIAPRVEIGSLRIERGLDISAHEKILPLPGEFEKKARLSSLSIAVEEYEIESGLIVTGEAGGELTIVPGEMPFSIHVHSEFFRDKFGPEIALADYVRTELKR